MQGRGRPDEDTRGRFPYGGWGTWNQDEVPAQEMGKGMGRPDDTLLGRRTWQDFTASWRERDDGNPFTAHLNAVTKDVASTALENANAWQHPVVLPGGAVAAVTERRAQDGEDLAVVGSAALVRSLHAAGLIDHCTLVIHPLTLGAEARLFEAPAPLARPTAPTTATTRAAVVAHHDRALP